ncbi:uncharacterized protein LOC135103981 [Scylla paramamosain]|uniref:uncharacterized protein LOC135103981 n=1 Tax=Scylla paramamosain TaxID=85552 RepID=UPI0030828875
MVKIVAVMLSSSLFQVILVRSCSTAAIASRQHERHLHVLSEVVSGPAHGKPLALHLDTALPADVRQAVLGVEAVRRTPHFTLSLGLNHSQGRWPRQETASAALSYGSPAMLHVVLWLTPRPELLKALWILWKPRHLLFFSLGSLPGTEVLRDEAVSNVEKLALIGHLSAEAERGPDALGVYTMLPFSSSGVQLLGPWEHESFSNWEALFPDRFPSFEGYTFQLATWMVDYPYLYHKNTNSLQGTGISIRALEAVSSLLNFSYTLTVKPPEPVYGGKLNGSWAGILGMILKKEKNFSINTFYLTPERYKDFDPSSYWGFSKVGAFLLTPPPLPMSLNLLRPFTVGVWTTIAFCFALAVCSCLMLERTANPRSSERRGVMGVLIELHCGLVNQSAPALLLPLWKRVFLAVWLLCCLVVTAAYTCNLVGIFTRPAYPRRLYTLQELTDSTFRYCNTGFTSTKRQ